MTIPQLRASFEHIDKIAMGLKGKDKETQFKEFRSEWKKIFGRTVSDSAIESYLAVKHSEKSKRTTRRRSKQKGGSINLSGAPIDYQTRPGMDGGYGKFPEYVAGGLSFANQINQPRGPTQAGGDLVRALAFSPFQHTSPPSIVQTALSNFAGTSEPVSSAVEFAAWQK